MQTDTKVAYPTDLPDGGGKWTPRARRRRAVVAVAVTAVGAIAAVLGFSVVGDDGDRAEQSPTTASSTAAPPTSAPSTSERGSGAGAVTTPPPATATAPAPEAVLEDGRHPVFLTALDTTARTVEFDLIQFLTGDEAVVAWDTAHPDQPGGPPNDYFIVNENPRLRVLPLADHVTVTVPSFEGGAGLHAQPIPLTDLPARLAGNPMPYDGRLWPNPFWLTVEHGKVTAMDEQYIP
jgi:hypothetical protein